MTPRIVSLIFLGLSLLAAISDFPRVSSRDIKAGEFIRGGDGGRRALLQTFTNRPGLDISREKAFSHIFPAPLDWNTREVSTPLELRRAICESQGHEYHADPITGDDVPVCTRINLPPVKILIILTSDIYLRGSKLPPVTDYLRIEGRCEVTLGRRCEIHAVSALCSRCQMPSEGAEDTMCAACRFGESFGRETTPLRLMGGAKIWLERIDMWGCRTQNNGGCIHVEAGNKLIWDETFDNDRFTYLRAEECKFSRGYAGEEGGAVFMDAGALAYFTECEFENNYAAGRSRELGNTLVGKSHDVYIGHFSASILESCEPAVPEITTRPAPTETVSREPYQQGQIYYTQAPPAQPPPPALPPPRPGSTPGDVVGEVIDDDDKAVPSVDGSSGVSDWGDDDDDDPDLRTSWEKARQTVFIAACCVAALSCVGCLALCWVCRIRRRQNPSSESGAEKDSEKGSNRRLFLIGTSHKFLLKPRLGKSPSPPKADDSEQSSPTAKGSLFFSSGTIGDNLEFGAIAEEPPDSARELHGPGGPGGAPAVGVHEQQKPAADGTQTLQYAKSFLPSPEDVVEQHLQVDRSRRSASHEAQRVRVSMDQDHPPQRPPVLLESIGSVASLRHCDSSDSSRAPQGPHPLPRRIEALKERQPSGAKCRIGSNDVEGLQEVPSRSKVISIRHMLPTVEDGEPELWAERSYTDEPHEGASPAAADDTVKVTVRSPAAAAHLQPSVVNASDTTTSVRAQKPSPVPIAEPVQEIAGLPDDDKDPHKESVGLMSGHANQAELDLLAPARSAKSAHEQSHKLVLGPNEERRPAAASEMGIGHHGDDSPRAHQARPRAARHTRKSAVTAHQAAADRLKGAWQISTAASKKLLKTLVSMRSPSHG